MAECELRERLIQRLKTRQSNLKQNDHLLPVIRKKTGDLAGTGLPDRLLVEFGLRRCTKFLGTSVLLEMKAQRLARQGHFYQTWRSKIVHCYQPE